MKSYSEQRNYHCLNDYAHENFSSLGHLSALSDSQLLHLLFKKKSNDINDVILRVIKEMDAHGLSYEPTFFSRIEGVSTEMAQQLAAGFELARRKLQPRYRKADDAEAIFRVVQNYAHLAQEHFIVISLNGANEILEVRVVTVGLVNRTQVHPREVFADALTDRATAVILAHNHPSGHLLPSQEDKNITERLTKAGAILGIQVLDHVIFSVRGYYSFAEQGIMPP